ncbi:MAG: imidazoleglycerol-phosphate dehydratase HisB [Ruminococcaceae bacterium]|nr:imidazoleglycerol-phosphate dehydratase HisB [Oscillospiraceae bacterium]
MRTSEILRKTKETDIELRIDLDGKGESEIDTSCGFLDHMLTLFAKHSRCSLYVKCAGDIEVDYHHTAEDIGICLGMAIKASLGDKMGIARYGNAIIPMDEALLMASIDLSGRSTLVYKTEGLTEKVGDFDTELVKEFFLALTRNAEMTLHIRQLDGENTHHILEGIFKAFAAALRAAVAMDSARAGEIPSTKGVL